ncbi:hypothetical protein EW146_g10369, partial [Bondarzewia mesenterica]
VESVHPSPVDRRAPRSAHSVENDTIARVNGPVGDGGWGGFQANTYSHAQQAHILPVAPLSASSDEANSSIPRSRSRPDNRAEGRRTYDHRSPDRARYSSPVRRSPVNDSRVDSRRRWGGDHYSPPRLPVRTPSPPLPPRKRGRESWPEDDPESPPRTRLRGASQWEESNRVHDERPLGRPGYDHHPAAMPPQSANASGDYYRPGHDSADTRRASGYSEPASRAYDHQHQGAGWVEEPSSIAPRHSPELDRHGEVHAEPMTASVPVLPPPARASYDRPAFEPAESLTVQPASQVAPPLLTRMNIPPRGASAVGSPTFDESICTPPDEQQQSWAAQAVGCWSWQKCAGWWAQRRPRRPRRCTERPFSISEEKTLGRSDDHAVARTIVVTAGRHAVRTTVTMFLLERNTDSTYWLLYIVYIYEPIAFVK